MVLHKVFGINIIFINSVLTIHNRLLTDASALVSCERVRYSYDCTSLAICLISNKKENHH